MRIKKEYLILTVVIVALALYLVLGKGEQPGSDLPPMTALDATQINRMVITQHEATLELIKKDEHWFILPRNYPVDPIKIKNMVKAAAKLNVTAVVSESGIFNRYDLDETKRIKIQIFSDDQMQREFDIGRAAPTFEHTFVKLANDTNVYHAQGRLNATFKQTIDGLRDKTALAFEKEAIVSLQIQKGAQSMTLSKSEIVEEAKKKGAEAPSAPVTKTQWQSAAGSTASNASINALLGSLSGLKCDAYLEDEAKAALKDAAWTITLKSDTNQWSLSTFAGKKKEASQIPAISSSNDFAFLLSKSRVDTIKQQMEKLLNPAPQN